MPVTRRLMTFVVGACLLSVGSPAATLAQDASPSPEPSGSAEPAQTCALLTEDEVSSAFDLVLTVEEGGSYSCTFSSDEASGTLTFVFTDIIQDTDLGTARAFLCGGALFDESPAPTEEPGCAVDVPVGQDAAVFLPGSSTMYVDIGGSDLLTLQLAGDTPAGVDLQAAFTGLATLAIPRLADMPMPTAEPQESIGPFPSFTSDAALEALFPTQIGGQDVAIQSLSGPDVADSGVPSGFLEALADIGKSIDDVSIGIGYSADGSVDYSITAFKVQGADMAALKPRLLPIIYQDAVDEGESPAPAPSLTEVPQTIGGKDVTALTVDGSTQYVYPKDDVLWVVSAQDPELTEILQKLP